jgi:hypothetical protein
VPQQPPVGLRIFLVKVSRLYSDTSHSDSGRVIGPSQITIDDDTQHSQQSDTHALSKIRTRIPCKRAAADPSLRPRGHWDRQIVSMVRFLTVVTVKVKVLLTEPKVQSGVEV